MKSNKFSKFFFIKSSLTFTVITALVVLVSFFYFSYSLSNYMLLNNQQKIEAEINLSVLKIEKNGINSFCSTLPLERSFRKTLITEKGDVVCDTLNKSLPSHKNRPELEILKTKDISFIKRYSNTTKEEMLYGAKIFHLRNNKYYLRVAIAMLSSNALLSKMIRETFFKAIPFIFLILLILFYLSFYFSKPIRRFYSQALDISDKIDSPQTQDISTILDQIDSNLESNKDNLKLEAKKNSILLNSISDGIFAIDHEENTLFQNILFNQIFSFHKVSDNNLEALIGKEIFSLYHNCLKTGEDQRVYNYGLDDKIIDIKISAIKNSKKEVVGAVGVYRDITETQKTQKLKTEFVTNISHELKTPLTSIKGYSELLLENSKDLKEMDLKYLNKILKNSNKLIDIYDNLLTLSKVEAKRELSKTKLEIKTPIEEIFSNLKNEYKKNATLILELEDQFLYVNSKLFIQVIFNLLENSFKYSSTNLSVEIRVFSENNESFISFKDNGIGIQSEKVSRIFERFYRVNESRSDTVQGTGIGLAIVKHIVEKHHGSIKVTSDSSGTEFILSLPKA